MLNPQDSFFMNGYENSYKSVIKQVRTYEYLGVPFKSNNSQTIRVRFLLCYVRVKHRL